jgi:hypothetical protein
MYFGDCETRVDLAFKLFKVAMRRDGRVCGGLKDIFDNNDSGNWFLVHQGNRIFWRPAIIGCCLICDSLMKEDLKELEQRDVKICGKVRTINA